MGYLIFDTLSYAFIAPPKAGQSICKLNINNYDYYLDNTPTLGYQNDTVNANGNVLGWVRDSKGIPLSDVKVMLPGWVENLIAMTDSTGFFTFSSLAQIQYLSFVKQNFVTQYFDVQVWPESTVTINITMSPVVSVERIKSQTIPKDFSISEPFPNPFNPETRIRYTLPRNSDVGIDVYDISGKLVDKVFSDINQQVHIKRDGMLHTFQAGYTLFRFALVKRH